MDLRWMLALLSFGALAAAPLEPKAPKLLTFEIAISTKSEMSRMAIRSFTEIFKKQHIAFHAIDYPSRRGIEELRNGRIDGSMGRIGDLNRVIGNESLVQIDFPIVTITASVWCRSDLDPKSGPIHIANRLGILLGARLIQLMDQRVVVEAVTTYQNIVQMLKSGRVDCFLADELLLETEGIPVEELAPFKRHNLVTVRAYPWISKRHAWLKPILEDGLRAYPFPPEYRQRFQSQHTACGSDFDVVCPDGVLFKKRIDLRKIGVNQG